MNFRFTSLGGGRRRLATIGLASGLAAMLMPMIVVPRGVGAEQPTAAAGAPAVVLPVVPRPPAEQPAVGLADDRHLDKTPPRRTKGLDLVRNGWTYNCMECHRLLTARWHYDRPMAEHGDVRLDHGNNRFCLNCHHTTNRNSFVDYDGAEIAQGDVVKLCAKCHGPIYQDWLVGVHGRSNGHWDAQKGAKTKLRCIQCHDPHQPKFQPMQPMPPLRYPSRAAHPVAANSPAHH